MKNIEKLPSYLILIPLGYIGYKIYQIASLSDIIILGPLYIILCICISVSTPPTRDWFYNKYRILISLTISILCYLFLKYTIIPITWISFFVLLIAAHIFGIIIGQLGFPIIPAALVGIFDPIFIMQMYQLINKDWYKVLNLIPFNIK